MTVEKLDMSANASMPDAISANNVITAEHIKKLKIKEKTFTKKQKSKTPLPVGTVFMSVICAILLMFIVFISIQITDYNSAVVGLSNDLKQLIQQEEELEFKLSQKNDLEYIEQQASAMGMVKEDKLPKKYVSVAGEDESIVLASDDEGGVYSLSALFSALGDSLSEIMEYIGS